MRFFHNCLADPVAPPDDPEAWLASVTPEPADYEPNHVKRWIAYRLAATSPGNANNNCRALSARFNRLLAEEEIEHHPRARMNPPHIPDQPIPIIAVQFIKQVRRDCQSRDFHSRRDEAIIQLIWDTGVCLSEIANIDLSRRVVNVLGKGSKWRPHPFSAAVGRCLRVRARQPYADTATRLWLSDRPRSTPLLPNGIKIMLRRLPDRASDGRALSPGRSAETSVRQPRIHSSGPTQARIIFAGETCEIVTTPRNRFSRQFLFRFRLTVPRATEGFETASERRRRSLVYRAPTVLASILAVVGMSGSQSLTGRTSCMQGDSFAAPLRICGVSVTARCGSERQPVLRVCSYVFGSLSNGENSCGQNNYQRRATRTVLAAATLAAPRAHGTASAQESRGSHQQDFARHRFPLGRPEADHRRLRSLLSLPAVRPEWARGITRTTCRREIS
ncbi:hypothetical protein [Amycolatopsis sp. NPDC003676]